MQLCCSPQKRYWIAALELEEQHLTIAVSSAQRSSLHAVHAGRVSTRQTISEPSLTGLSVCHRHLKQVRMCASLRKHRPRAGVYPAPCKLCIGEYCTEMRALLFCRL